MKRNVRFPNFSNPDTNFSCNNLPNTISKNDPSEEPNIQFNVDIKKLSI